MPFPIVEHCKADPPSELYKETARLAESLRREHPELIQAGEFQRLVVDHLSDGPALHLDDLSEISRLDPGEDVRFYQDRARLRAGDGDLVASCGDPIAGHEEYCRDNLGLGSPRWLRPRPPRNGMRIAEACWEDASVREVLLRKLRRGLLEFVHPHMGTFAVWELAALLHEASGRPLRVVAPPPRLTKWVNNKVAFSETVSRLFGPEFVPRTESAWSLSVLAQRVAGLAQQAEAIGLKLPDSGGGGGNVVLPTGPLRGKSPRDVLQTLRAAAAAVDWRGDRELLLDVWEANVLCSPSAQLWLPPETDGPPIVEGIFQQITEGKKGMFTGTVPAELPSAVRQQIVDRCWLLAVLYQRLGYVGRCSFDLILVGDDYESCRVEFIECNGRWGGTSLPMTLVNRIFGDWASQSFAVQVFHHLPGLKNVSFADLLAHFREDLFDARTKQGSLIFYNPGRLQYQSGVSAIMLGSTPEQAVAGLRGDVAGQLTTLASRFPHE
jgi:hypothetical protein